MTPLVTVTSAAWFAVVLLEMKGPLCGALRQKASTLVAAVWLSVASSQSSFHSASEGAEVQRWVR
jgi:hypothetical protein